MSEQLPEHRRLPPAWHATPLPPPPEPASGGSTVSIRHFLSIMRRHMRLVFLTAALGLAAGFYLASQETAVYRATAAVRLVGERRSITNEPDAVTQSMKSVDPMFSLASLIKNRSVLREVVDTLGLQLVPITPGFDRTLLRGVRVPQGGTADTVVLRFTPESVEGRLGPRRAKAKYGEPLDLGPVQLRVSDPPAASTAAFEVQPEEVQTDWLISQLSVIPRQSTDLIGVTLISPEPRLAQEIVNTVVRVFKTLNIRSAQERSRRKRETLDEQFKRTDSMLAIAKSQLATFRSRQLMASSQNRLVQEQQTLVAVESQITNLQADRQTLAGLLDALSRGGENDRQAALRALAVGGAVAGGSSIENRYQELNVLQTRLDSMTTGRWALAPNNPDVVTTKSHIKTAEQNLIGAVQSQVAAIDKRVAALNSSRGSTGATIQMLPAMVEEEMQLTRDVERLASKADNLENESQGAHMAEAVEAGDVDIIELAAVPYVPEPGSGPVKVGVGLLLGLIFGCAAAFLLEAMNKSIRRPEELEGTLQIPGLAVIPPLTPTGNGHHQRQGLYGLLRGAKRAPVADRTKIGPTGTTSQPFSVGTEAFRMLRTSLIWSEPGGDLKTLVITSAAPGEGKTLTAANLAATFAYEGLRVLLIDCDIRRPRLHGLFRVPRAPGLMELLNASEDGRVPEAGIAETIRMTSVKGLSLLSCGSLPTDPSTLLSGARMRTLLRHLGQTFDLVILDTPPVLATADAGILGALADGVLLVVRAGQTDRDAARRAQQQLVHVGARVVGAVLNDPGGEVAFEGDYYYPYDYAAE